MEFPAKLGNYFRDFCNFSRFFAPRGPDAPGLVKPMEFHTFLGVFGALGPNFRQNQLFP